MTESNTLGDLWEYDVTKILATFLAIYAGYVVMGLISGLPTRGIVATLVQLTLLIALYAMLTLALNLQWGYTGLFNIGIVGFMAVGAYTMLMVSKPPVDPSSAAAASQIGGLGLPVIVGILAGVIAAALLGFVVALPALRLRADYLAITTIAMSEIVRFIFLSSSFQEFSVFGNKIGTGGGRGLIVNFEEPISRIFFDTGAYEGLVTAVNEAMGVQGTMAPVVDTAVISVVLLVVVAGYFWLFKRTGESPFGRVLKAIREDEDVARALGKNTNRFKIKSFMLGCALMGLAGAFYAMYFLGAVNPTAFKPQFTFFVWVALIIGGSGSNTGSVIGSAIFVGVLFQGPLYMKNVVEALFTVASAPPSFAHALSGIGPFIAYMFENISHFRIIALGIVLIVLMKRRPDGIMGHRKETAASIPLIKLSGYGRDAAADGGDAE
ncbi:branched-chain amino acid ABC transporter permease [Haloarculaceae archaeon H-GB2-1]|nr:branched-chain amino acid ABC transporter permease [Haloarculaceae archaeon H-GB1-1]MEA5386699.1 branched-chain amino acid ABC transporter permease [Haloarculaceae archaeon H-GB11]MEA5408227.1 branched-chain amino acid ABC transporter permease [Haloarculaceae archaeon H-GB2-1]